MKTTIKYLMLIAALINITACNSLSNVVPHSGPTMEQVYDGMNKKTSSITDNANTNNNESSSDTNDQSTQLRSTARRLNSININTEMFVTNRDNNSTDAIDKEFHKLPNPEINMYVFPHLAGSDQVPIPGYTTAFNVYEHDYYALPNEL